VCICRAWVWHAVPERTDLTEERFIASPFAAAPYDRLYKTGEPVPLASRRQCGVFGSSGFPGEDPRQRIELGEIEAVLSEHPALRKRWCWPARLGRGEALVAYVVPHNEARPSVDELRNHVQSRLPEYMVPSAFVVLESFPLSPNGKVDRKALPEPSGSRPDLEKQYVAPRTPTEQTLADIWRSCWESIRWGFMTTSSSWGHSLLATQLVSRVRNTLQAEVPLRTCSSIRP